jgi:hypothetical protein
LLDYISGKNGAQGGPTFSQGQAGIPWDWWAWGNLNGQPLEGTMDANGMNPVQKDVVDQLIVGTCADAVAVLRNIPAPATDAAIESAMTTASAQIVPVASSGSAPTGSTAQPPGMISPGGSLTDASGNAWDITQSGSIRMNGQWVPGGGGTASLSVQDGVVYGLDAFGRGWFTLNNGQYWTPSPAPSSTTTMQTTTMQVAATMPQTAMPTATTSTPEPTAAAAVSKSSSRRSDSGWSQRPDNSD